MFYALGHGHPLVNGYSGGAPEPYLMLSETLADFGSHPDEAWQAVLASGATHVIVHESGYEPGRGRRVTTWLLSSGAHLAAAFDSDRVVAIIR